MLLTPKAPRFSVEEGEGLRIDIPCKKDWFRILFFSLWMVGWYSGEFHEIPKVLAQLRSGEVQGFDLVWLAMWTFGGLFLTAWIVWRLLGSEVLRVESGNVTLRKRILAIGRTWEFDASHILALRFRPEHGAGKGYRESRIELDYGAKTYNFAAGIQPAEASQLFRLVARWAPAVHIENAVEPANRPPVQSLGLS